MSKQNGSPPGLGRARSTATRSSPKDAYSIVIPPPNVTGVLTLGHVLNNTIQDILARKARMDGKEVLWLPGTDHAGIATQARRREARSQERRRRPATTSAATSSSSASGSGRRSTAASSSSSSRSSAARCDWTRERFTMDQDYSRCVQRVFVELYQKGLIYRGKRMVNWCPASLTALSRRGSHHEGPQSDLYYIQRTRSSRHRAASSRSRPPAPRRSRATPVSPSIPRTTATGTSSANTCAGPSPERRRSRSSATSTIDIEFGTGVLKVTPAHDKADFEIGLKNDLPIIDVLNPDGTMNDLAGNDFAGLDRFVARRKAVELLIEMFHQGTDIVPMCFIAAVRPDHDDAEAHAALLANMLAQATALATGTSAEVTDPQRQMAGERPSEIMLLDELSPFNLGQLLALYEHKVFVESVIWGINPFDQFGVELGKVVAGTIQPALENAAQNVPASYGLDAILDYIRNK